MECRASGDPAVGSITTGIEQVATDPGAERMIRNTRTRQDSDPARPGRNDPPFIDRGILPRVIGGVHQGRVHRRTTRWFEQGLALLPRRRGHCSLVLAPLPVQPARPLEQPHPAFGCDGILEMWYAVRYQDSGSRWTNGFFRGRSRVGAASSGQPTLPSRDTASSFCASTANSIGSLLSTSLQ